jgi:hypothetical protein
MQPRPEPGEPLEREVDVLRRAVSLIQERLPALWSFSVIEQATLAGRRVDAIVSITGPDGVDASLIVGAKRSVVTADLPKLTARLGSLVADNKGRDDQLPLVVARYLPLSAQRWLEDKNVAYADATGNIRISLNRPGLFLRNMGATKDPWRGPGRPRGSLKGAPAARVVRALVDFNPPVTVPELVVRAGASTGATYRVVEFLQQEALVERTPRGPIVTVQWRQLIERWAEDYGFQDSNVTCSYLQPRGLATLLKDLVAAADLRYAVTGSVAAQNWAPYAPARSAMIYVDDPERFAQRLGLREVQVGANVLLATSTYDVVYDRSQNVDGVSFAAPSQTVVDLLTGPGRNPAEAEALLEWMERNPDAWRR